MTACVVYIDKVLQAPSIYTTLVSTDDILQNHVPYRWNIGYYWIKYKAKIKLLLL